MSTCTAKTNATRNELWDTFLKFRKEGRQPLLLASRVGGWSYVALPAQNQPVWDDQLDFLRDFRPTEHIMDGGPDFVGGWLGFLSYFQGLKWMGLSSRHVPTLPLMQWWWCDEVHAFQVEEEAEPFQTSFEVRYFQPMLDFDAYLQRFERLHAFLRMGESYQVNLTMDFVGDFTGDPFDFYRAMFAKNPGAMSVYFEMDDWVLASNSPERLFSFQEGVLRAEPIKGTLTKPHDPALLLNDPKAYSELTMIVDLLRNDLGRVAETGSVRVLKHRALMELQHLWHTYSVVEARLRSDLCLADALRSIFPGGSITGCPKKRSMSIIDSLEDFGRDAYTGSFGYISKNGRADFNILIRTATLRGQAIHVPAGGGVLIESDARLEYEEALAKVQNIASLC